MRYRLLEAHEWEKLVPLATELSVPLPPKEAAAVVVAEENDIIYGALFLQLALHLEPLLISPSGRGKVDFRRLTSSMESSLKEHGQHIEYFAFIENPKVARMAEIEGMEELPYKVWRKVVK